MSLGASMMRKRRFFHSTSDVLALKAAIPPTQCCRKSVHRPVVAETVHGTASARSLALARHEVSGRDSNTEIPDFSLYSNDCFKGIRVRRLSGLTQLSTLTPFARPCPPQPYLESRKRSNKSNETASISLGRGPRGSRQGLCAGQARRFAAGAEVSGDAYVRGQTCLPRARLRAHKARPSSRASFAASGLHLPSL